MYEEEPRLRHDLFIPLQPENIVLKDSTAGQLKIIDFGTAQDLSINPCPKVMLGTPEFIGKTCITSVSFLFPHSYGCTHCACY